MKKFRVMRGAHFGITYNAETAREAVSRDNAANKPQEGFDPVIALFGDIPSPPIVAVYELVPVDRAQW